jgi:hypothetical protein
MSVLLQLAKGDRQECLSYCNLLGLSGHQE